MRRTGGVLVFSCVVATLTSCTGGATVAHSVSTLKVQVGQCVVPPKMPTAELSTVSVVDCTTKHTQEAYARIDYLPPASAPSKDLYPGPDALKKFADGACAQDYQDYVGVAYADSALFFTYLLPSARGWQKGDREVTCFVTTTGASITRSVKGSKL